jgi:redox-regulated HSP33 family molecular chaperone
MSFLKRFMDQIATSGVTSAIATFEHKVPGMTTGQVEDHLDQNTRKLADLMSQYAQRSEQIPADVIAVAVATGYYAAELHNRTRRDRA